MRRSCATDSVAVSFCVAAIVGCGVAAVWAGVGVAGTGGFVGTRVAVDAFVGIASGASRTGVEVGAAVGCAKAWQPLSATNRKKLAACRRVGTWRQARL